MDPCQNQQQHHRPCSIPITQPYNCSELALSLWLPAAWTNTLVEFHKRVSKNRPYCVPALNLGSSPLTSLGFPRKHMVFMLFCSFTKKCVCITKTAFHFSSHIPLILSKPRLQKNEAQHPYNTIIIRNKLPLGLALLHEHRGQFNFDTKFKSTWIKSQVSKAVTVFEVFIHFLFSLSLLISF